MPLSNKSVSLPSDGQIAFIVSGADSNTNFLRVNGSTTTGTGMSAQTGTGSIGIALDMDNKKIWWSDLSGNYFNSGNPATGSNAQVDFSSTGEYANDVVTPFVSMYQGSNKTVSINFQVKDLLHIHSQQVFRHYVQQTYPTQQYCYLINILILSYIVQLEMRCHFLV